MSRILKVMGALLRGTSPLIATLALATLGHAYVLIDDFTVGDYHRVINWPSNQDHGEVTGLDTAHCALGRRASDLSVMTNFDHVPIGIDIGGGSARVSYNSPSGDIAVDDRITIGPSEGQSLDLSGESQIWVDLSTEDPSGRFADEWSLIVQDASGHFDASPNWLLRQGGIYFRKTSFSGMDWGRVSLIVFRQKFSPDIGPVPQAFSVTSIYAVPEPCTLLALVPLTYWAGRRVRRPASTH